MPTKEKVREITEKPKEADVKPPKRADAEKRIVTDDPTKCYINREISWLAFNQRVLLEAADKSVPLLERLKFLMIYQSNLEEFFRVRVGILTHRALLMPNKKDPLSGWLPSEQIEQVLNGVREQQDLVESVWKVLRAELKDHGIDVLDFKKVSKVDELMSKKLFGDIKNLLFPQIIEINQPLPFLWGEESYVVAFLGRGAEQKLAIIPLDRIPPYLTFEIDGCQKIVLTSQLIRHFLPLLLKKETITQSAVIKVTRNADVFLSEKAPGGNADLRQKMESMLSKRKRELPVRLQIFGKLADAERDILVKKLKISDNRVFSTLVPFDLSFRSCIAAQEHFKYDERRPVRNIGLKKGEYFDYIDKHDLLLAFPFQSMLPFVDLLYEAADDPDVLSIKITLYRLSSSSKVAAALAYAADRGKDVLCLLELRARFDEQNNIDYSEMLEDAGCHIVYGLPDHKVHSKLCVITRQKDGNISHITQVGTGNYNEVTSEQYTDLSLITSNEGAAQDAEAAFAALTKAEFPPEAHTLWLAPLSYKNRVIEMLDREIAKGSEGRVAVKVNAVNNLDVMEKLIECSQAGVKVELFVRGICCLRPGIPGMTDNIVIKSVVGRWLEHSRIFKFGDGDDAKMFIGSGDFLSRNLERRVEAFIEGVTPETRAQINEILFALRNDREKSRTMQPDGSYIRRPGGDNTSSQEALYRYFSKIRVDSIPVAPEQTTADREPVKDDTVRAFTAAEEKAATSEKSQNPLSRLFKRFGVKGKK
jgi:polyphosphate kinase